MYCHFIYRGKKCKPLFVQIARQVVKLKAHDLRLPARAWKVKLIGEGADDAGGVFDDTITEMCQVRVLQQIINTKRISSFVWFFLVIWNQYHMMIPIYVSLFQNSG